MSRFDRRLKGTGLRPGQSTCKIGREKTGSSPDIRQYATMSWNGNLVTGRPTPTYKPNIENVQQQNVMSVQNSAVSAPTGLSLNNKTATVRVLDSEKLDMNARMRDLDELAIKNARLEEAEKTAPNQPMRLITRHEIRLNTLEALSLRMEHLEQIQNGCARMNSLDDRMIEDLKNDLWAQLQSRHDVEVQKVVMGMKDEIMELRLKIEDLESKNVKGDEPVKKSTQITLNIEESNDDKAETSDAEEDIKKAVALAISQVEAGEV